MKIKSLNHSVKSNRVLKMEIPKDHFHHTLLVYFLKGKNALDEPPVVEKVLKKNQVDQHISSHNIATELNRNIKQFRTIYIRLDTKKSLILGFHMN